MATATATIEMLPYKRKGEIDYDNLDFDPNEPVQKPDAMEQNPALMLLHSLLYAHITDYGGRRDIFLDANTIICYDPSNLNIRVSPDIYLAMGVDADAIRPRKIYLPWEVGKPPDWVIEIASSSTGDEDVGRKREIYAAVGVSEYWRFDPTGGAYHGEPLAGERLVDGVYRRIELTDEPDGVPKGYSEVLGLHLCWDDGEPRLYDNVTDTYLETSHEIQAARLAAEEQAEIAEERLEIAEAENARLREMLRRLQG